MQPCSRAMAVRGADAVSLSPFRIQRFLSCLSNALSSIVSPATYHVALSALAHTLYAVRVASVRSLIEFYQCLLPPTCLPNSAIGILLKATPGVLHIEGMRETARRISVAMVKESGDRE